jgi:hypothetical protein
MASCAFASGFSTPRPMPTEYEFVRPRLYPAQQRAIFDATDPGGKAARYALIEASTKAGKTAGCIIWLFEEAFVRGGPGRNYWWVAPVYPQAKIAFRRLKRALDRTLYRANETELTVSLPNGAVLWFKSAEKADNLYGEDVHAAVIDEASRVREDAWIAVRSTLTATAGPVRIIGNVKGRRNWFYRMARRAEAGESGMAFARLTALDAVAGGVLAQSEIDDARRLLPEDVFRELYLAEASDDAGNPFGMTHIAACVAPLSADRAVVCGVDLAKSVDWSVVVGLDRAGTACGFARWQGPWERTEREVLDLVGRTPTLIDSTGVGDPIVERLQKRRRNVFTGFHFSSASKQRIMEGLAAAIQNREVRFPDGPIRAELELFEYEYTRTGVRYTAPDGYHDDCVVALALAVEHYRTARRPDPGTRPAQITRISPWLGGDGLGDPHG